MHADINQLMAALAEAGDTGLTETQTGAPADELARLMANGEIVRRGGGTEDEPYTFHLPNDGAPRL